MESLLASPFVPTRVECSETRRSIGHEPTATLDQSERRYAASTLFFRTCASAASTTSRGSSVFPAAQSRNDVHLLYLGDAGSAGNLSAHCSSGAAASHKSKSPEDETVSGLLPQRLAAPEGSLQ